MLIIASAPLRISLLGGGTDMVEYFGTKDHIGACLSMSINRGIYCIIQDADALYIDEEAASPLTDAVIELFRIVYGEVPKVRISFREDIPTRGTGLGSSSAWCGALTRALKQYAVSYMKKWTPKYEKFCPTIVTSADLSLMAEHTYMMERIAGMYCGKQDHYSAVNRGVNLYSFFHDTVMTQRQDVDASMIDRMVLFNIGGNRNSETILKEQAGNIKSQLDELDAMASLARLGAVHLTTGAIDSLADCMLDAWRIKRTYADGVSNERVDGIYHEAIKAGALAGKILGAGGAGYMFFLCRDAADTNKVQKALEKLPDVTRVNFGLFKGRQEWIDPVVLLDRGYG